MSFSQLDLFGKLHHGKKIIDFPFFFLFAEFSEIANWLCNDLIYEIISYLASYLKENRLNEENGQPINKTDLQALAELTHYMDEHYSFNITLQTLSTIACMSESKMKKLFKSVYNMSITEYIQRKRISVAEHMLIQTDLTIAEISRIVGYSNPSRLIEIFKRYYGFTPSKYRK